MKRKWKWFFYSILVLVLLMIASSGGLWCYFHRVRTLPDGHVLPPGGDGGYLYRGTFYCGSDDGYHYILVKWDPWILDERYRIPADQLVVMNPFPRTRDKSKFVPITYLRPGGSLDAKTGEVLNPLPDRAALHKMIQSRNIGRSQTDLYWEDFYYCGSDVDYHYISIAWINLSYSRGSDVDYRYNNDAYINHAPVRSKFLYRLPVNQLEVIGPFPRTSSEKMIKITSLKPNGKIDARSGIVMP